ncbi:type II secretion system F family protein [Geodermatophilus sp. SYSU D00815]
MTAALLALAAALLAWPDAGALRRARLGPRPRATASRLRPGPRSAPVLVGAAVAAGAAIASTPLVAGLAGACAALAARAELGRRQAARREAASAAVTQALGALAAELRSGRPLEVAAAAAARTCSDDGVGAALVRAVRAPAPPAPGRRAPPRPAEAALDRLAAAVRLSRDTGAALSEVVAAVEDDLRARHRRRLELRSALSAPRASATLLAGLPLLGLAMGSGVGADPWRVLTATGPGQVLLVVGVGLEVAGVAWSRRLASRATRRAVPEGR